MKSTVQRLWTAFHLQPHRQKHFPLSTDPFFAKKVRDIVGLHLHSPDHAMVLRFPYTGPHERCPGRKRQFDGCFNRCHPARMARTSLKKEKVDLHHAVLYAKA